MKLKSYLKPGPALLKTCLTFIGCILMSNPSVALTPKRIAENGGQIVNLDEIGSNLVCIKIGTSQYPGLRRSNGIDSLFDALRRYKTILRSSPSRMQVQRIRKMVLFIKSIAPLAIPYCEAYVFPAQAPPPSNGTINIPNPSAQVDNGLAGRIFGKLEFNQSSFGYSTTSLSLGQESYSFIDDHRVYEGIANNPGPISQFNCTDPETNSNRCAEYILDSSTGELTIKWSYGDRRYSLDNKYTQPTLIDLDRNKRFFPCGPKFNASQVRSILPSGAYSGGSSSNLGAILGQYTNITTLTRIISFNATSADQRSGMFSAFTSFDLVFDIIGTTSSSVTPEIIGNAGALFNNSLSGTYQFGSEDYVVELTFDRPIPQMGRGPFKRRIVTLGSDYAIYLNGLGTMARQ